jgi:hypothetical protein
MIKSPLKSQKYLLLLQDTQKVQGVPNLEESVLSLDNEEWRD